MAHGDYAKWNGFYTPKNTDVEIATGDTAIANVISPKTANHQIWVQKITLSITTHAASVYTFDDDGAGPPIAAHTDAVAAAGIPSTVTWDFGPQGYGLTIGANLDIAKTSTGVAIAHIEAYELLAIPMAIGPNN